jgi:tetratricopeptide (TPR) repeat protein
MARGKQHLKRRPQANARVAAPAPKAAPKAKRSESHPSWEDQLFFSRLRVHAKWMFVLLALAFGLGFVLFGIGTGSGGVADVMQGFFSNNSVAGGKSLSSLQSNATNNPKDPTAWRELATKLQTEQKTDEALVALEHYVSLKPKDERSLGELASLYSLRASDFNVEWSQALGELQTVAPSGAFKPKETSPLGKAFANQDPITDLIVKRLEEKANAASRKVGELSTKAQSAYKRLVALDPENATYQFQYGNISQTLGRKAVAIKAYKTFLKLAPNDSLAPAVRKQLKVLSAPAAKT